MTVLEADVLIIGGGIVGLTLACSLATLPLNIQIIDHCPLSSWTGLLSPYDLRVNAISPAAQAYLDRIGIWSAITALRVNTYQQMRVWDANSPAHIHFNHNEVGQSCLGYIVEHSVLHQVLLTRLQSFDNVQIQQTLTPLSAIETSECVTVTFNPHQVIKAQLLIGADGNHSWVANTLLPQLSEPMGEGFEKLYALVAVLRTEKPHLQTALQRFLLTGPIALLPLEDPHLVSLIWSTTAFHSDYLKQLSADMFNSVVTGALEYILGQLTICSQKSSFVLNRHHMRNYVKTRVALIGDAAHTILPLAGQGLNLGLSDAECLAKIIQESIQKKRDIGSIVSLRRYERWRRSENTLMLLATEALHKIFSMPDETARYIRQAGFAAVTHLPWMKRYLMRRAMGLY